MAHPDDARILCAGNSHPPFAKLGWENPQSRRMTPGDAARRALSPGGDRVDPRASVEALTQPNMIGATYHCLESDRTGRS